MNLILQNRSGHASLVDHFNERHVTADRRVQAVTKEFLLPSHRRVAIAKDQRKALISAVAMDVGKEMVAYLEVMYPDVFERMNSGCKLSIRNHIHNDIMDAMETGNAENHLERLRERAKRRREWVASYRNLRRNRPKKLTAK